MISLAEATALATKFAACSQNTQRTLRTIIAAGSGSMLLPPVEACLAEEYLEACDAAGIYTGGIEVEWSV